MPMPMRGNIIHGISAIITMMSCLCASVFSNQPSLCVCAESTPVQAAGGAHTPPKKETACVCEEEEGNSQSNEPTNQPSEATSACVCVCVKKK